MCYSIPGIAESSFSVLHAVVNVSPSLFITVITDRAPIEDGRHQVFGRWREGWASMQTDRHTGLHCISELDSLTALWVSISNHKPCALFAVTCALQWPSYGKPMLLYSMTKRGGRESVFLSENFNNLNLCAKDCFLCHYSASILKLHL